MSVSRLSQRICAHSIYSSVASGSTTYPRGSVEGHERLGWDVEVVADEAQVLPGLGKGLGHVVLAHGVEVQAVVCVGDSGQAPCGWQL